MELLATDCVSSSSIGYFFDFLLSIESISIDMFL